MHKITISLSAFILSIALLSSCSEQKDDNNPEKLKEKIDTKIEQINEKISEYEEEMKQASEEKKMEIEEKIDELREDKATL